MSDLMQQIAGWSAAGAAGVGLAGSAALLRRRLSRDKTEIVKDRAADRILKTAMAERDEARAEARAIWIARAEDSAAIARLTAQNEHQAAEIARLELEFESYKRMLARLSPESRQFLGTDFAPPPL
jgi:Spy/CpxP family protein refolding chaperone